MAAITNGASQHVAQQAAADGAASDDVKALRNRYDYTRFGDNMKNELIEDLLNRYEALVQTHKDYVEAHQQEREAAQTSVTTIRGLQSSVGHLQKLLNRDPFILVLIDGNGTIFHQNFLKQGALGGQTAASTLENAVLNWARGAIADIPGDTKIMVRIYGNVRAIAETCAQHGMVDSPSRFDDFVRAFNSTSPLFDFVDVGASGAAHDKVIETFKLHVYNYYCRHVLVGCSYDDAYCSSIQPYMDSEQARLRMTLLEGTPFGPGQKALPVERLKIPGIFRDAKLILPPTLARSDSRMRVGSITSLNATSNIFTPRTITPATLSSPLGSFGSLDQNSMARVDSQDASSDAGMWSTVASRNAHRPMKDMTMKESSGPAPSIQRNKYGQRIDAPMNYDREEVQRVKKLKACNQYYIGIGCCHFNAGKADKCPHSHSYDFSPADLKTLRLVARETPCKRGSECDDPKCIYGHQCPFALAVEGSMRGSGYCVNGENCRFPASMHGVDQTPMKITKVIGI